MLTIMPRYRSLKTQTTDRLYREAHRLEASERTRAWAKADPEKRKESYKKYREGNKEKIRLQKKAWRKANPEKHQAANRRWKINTTLKICDFNALLLKQNGKCAICQRPDSGRKQSGRLAIDHCHATNAVRGLLCHPCNSMLGLAKDSIETLSRAIAYLEQSNDSKSGGSVC